MSGTVFEYVIHTEELWFVVHNHAGVRRDGNLAVSECVQSIYGLVRRYIIRKMYENVGFKTVDENAEEYIMVCEL